MGQKIRPLIIIVPPKFHKWKENHSIFKFYYMKSSNCTINEIARSIFLFRQSFLTLAHNASSAIVFLKKVFFSPKFSSVLKKKQKSWLFSIFKFQGNFWLNAKRYQIFHRMHEKKGAVSLLHVFKKRIYFNFNKNSKICNNELKELSV